MVSHHVVRSWTLTRTMKLSTKCSSSNRWRMNSARPFRNSMATLPSPFQLARWALRGTERAEDTAVASLGLQNLMTSGALVEVDADLARHDLGLAMTAQRTSAPRA